MLLIPDELRQFLAPTVVMVLVYWLSLDERWTGMAWLVS
jgi:hypothetical protein